MTKHTHYISKCTYHIVFCTKYRHKILYGKVKDIIVDKINDICSDNDYSLLDYSLELDHIHICISIKPIYSISSVIHKLKFISAFYVFKLRPDIKFKYFWGTKHFWSRGYFVSTVGNVSTDTVLKYIKSQENYNETN